MTPKALEKLTSVSVRGRRYVALDEVLALLAAQEQPEPPAVPRRTKEEAKPS